MSSIKLLFLSGSIRNDSYNKKLALYAKNLAAQQGVDASFIDLSEFSMPLYHGDEEAVHGLPDNAKRLKELFIESDGFFIASPEYNGSFSAMLKNTIDWMSRPSEENESPLIAFNGKVAAISSTSPGPLGGLRGLVPLRMLLGNIRVHVIPEQAAIGSYGKAFDESGELVSDQQKAMLKQVVDSLINTSSKLSK